MNVLVAAIILLVMTISTGVIAFYIVHHQSSIGDLNNTVTDIETNILKDETENSTNFVTVADAILSNKKQTDLDKIKLDKIATDIQSASSALKLNVHSGRVSLDTPTTATLGDSISLSTTAPAGSTNPHKDGTAWLQVTDKDSSNYASVGVGSMWAERGVTISSDACVDFGIGGNTLCGSQLTLTGASTVDPKNLVNPGFSTIFPGDTTSLGKNRLVGDTVLTGDTSIGGNVSLGNSGAVGVGMLSTKTASHIYSGIDDSLTESSLTLGFTHRPIDGTLPKEGADVVRVTRNKTGHHVKIFGSLDVCDSDGNNCTAVGVRPGPAPVFVSTGPYSNWRS